MDTSVWPKHFMVVAALSITVAPDSVWPMLCSRMSRSPSSTDFSPFSLFLLRQYWPISSLSILSSPRQSPAREAFSRCASKKRSAWLSRPCS